MIDYQLLAIQNPWWQNSKAIEQDSKIKEFQRATVQYSPTQILGLDLKPGAINIVFGPRQTGKSAAIKLRLQTLLREGIQPEHILYFNCDALETRQDVIDVVISSLGHEHQDGKQTEPRYLFLDEISSVPDWPYAIKWLADAGQLEQCRMILTGSSSVSLKKSGELMPGRRKGGVDIRFLPINFFTYARLIHPDVILPSPARSFRELSVLHQSLQRKRINAEQLHRAFLKSGGFLSVINSFAAQESPAPSVELYVSSLKSELAKAGKKEPFARAVLQKIVASLTAETSYTNVAEEAELGSKNTAIEYLRFFCDSFLLNETLYYSIPERRVVLKKNKKYYPADPFLIWIFHLFITGAQDIAPFFNAYATPEPASQLTESFIASELGKKDAAWHWFKNGRELDFYCHPNRFQSVRRLLNSAP